MTKFGALLLLLLAACSKGAPDETSGAAGNSAAPAAAEAQPVAYASLAGDPARGETLFLQCKMCHTTLAGQNRLGPTLHGVVGRAAAAVPSYLYSPAMKASGLTWTEEELYAFLESPQKTVPGTKMAFAGVKTPQDRADIISWLETQTD